jgi:hypothetical protein
MSPEKFCVWQFFEDGTSEKVRDWVPLEEAVKAFKHYTTSIAARVGLVKQVLIVDQGDLTCAHWTKEQGLVYPGPED